MSPLVITLIVTTIINHCYYHYFITHHLFHHHQTLFPTLSPFTIPTHHRHRHCYHYHSLLHIVTISSPSSSITLFNTNLFPATCTTTNKPVFITTTFLIINTTLAISTITTSHCHLFGSYHHCPSSPPLLLHLLDHHISLLSPLMMDPDNFFLR